MAVTKALSYTPVEDIEVEANRAFNEEVLLKVIRNINLLGDLSVIGSVNCILLNQPGTPVPPSTVFQLANGSEITESTSPLKSSGITNRFTPDMTGRFIRGADASTTIGNEAGGAASISTTHSHGGETSAYQATLINGEFNEATDWPSVSEFFPFHTHAIGSQQIDVGLDPLHLEITMFLKIT